MDDSNRHHGAFFLSGKFAYALYLILAQLLLPIYRLQLNPDAVSYFTIAREYWDRLFPDAINGSYGPLYSWLLAPLIGMGVGGPLAARLLAIPIGALVIWTADRLGRRLALTDGIRRAIRLALVIPVLSLGFIVVTPDLLATAMALAYLAVICSPRYLERAGMWAAAGLLGVAMYLAKAYGMWFFVGHFAAMHLIWLFQLRAMRWRVVAAWLIGMAVFAIAASPWVAALSHKQGHFALNTTTTYNHAIEAPHAPEFPPAEMGLLAPQTREAVSVWEDPSAIHLPDWNEFANGANFRHFLLVIARNLGDWAEEMCGYSLLLPAILIAAAIVMVRRRFAGAESILALAAVVYPLGYFLLHLEQRFLSAEAIVLIVLGGFLIQEAARLYAIPRLHARIAIGVLCISLLPNAVWNIVRYAGGEGKRLQRIGLTIAEVISPHANVASDEDWFTSMYASYYAQVRYYGLPMANESAGQFARDLDANRIEYLLIWNDPHAAFLSGWTRVSPVDAPGPIIFAHRRANS